MEDPFYFAPPPIVRCEACFVVVGIDDVYCANCRYPLKGTVAEKSTFLEKQNKADFDLVAFKKRINKAGNTLFYLSGLFILAAVVNFFSMKADPDVLAVVIPDIVLAVLFLLLGEYSKKKNLACFISGLSLFVIVQILEVLDDPAMVDLYYIVFVIIVVLFLIRGIKSAIGMEKIKKEHNIA
jgi:hypothetical protein